MALLLLRAPLSRSRLQPLSTRSQHTTRTTRPRCALRFSARGEIFLLSTRRAYSPTRRSRPSLPSALRQSWRRPRSGQYCQLPQRWLLPAGQRSGLWWSGQAPTLAIRVSTRKPAPAVAFDTLPLGYSTFCSAMKAMATRSKDAVQLSSRLCWSALHSVFMSNYKLGTFISLLQPIRSQRTTSGDEANRSRCATRPARSRRTTRPTRSRCVRALLHLHLHRLPPLFGALLTPARLLAHAPPYHALARTRRHASVGELAAASARCHPRG